MSGVASITGAGSGSATGAVVFTSTQPGLLTIGSGGSNVNFNPVSVFVTSVGSKNGDVELVNPNNSMTIAPETIAPNVDFITNTSNSGMANLTNLDASNAGQWVASNAYYKGDCAFDVPNSNDLYIARQDIAQSTTNPSGDATNWVKLATTAGGAGVSGTMVLQPTAWSSGTSYTTGQVATYQGGLFVWTGTASSVAGVAPDSDTGGTNPNEWVCIGKVPNAIGSSAPYPGLMYNQGAWSGSSSYHAGDVVQNGGTTYICVAQSSSNAIFPTGDFVAIGGGGGGGINGIAPWTAQNYGSNTLVSVNNALFFTATGATSAQDPTQSPWVPVALYWKGTYQNATQYYPYNVVEYNGGTWISLTGNSNFAPTAGSNWQNIGGVGIQSLAGTGLSTPTSASNIQFTSSGSNISITTASASNTVDLNYVGSLSGGLTGFPNDGYAWVASNNYNNLQDVVSYKAGLFATQSAYAPTSNQPWGTATKINWAQLVPNLAISQAGAPTTITVVDSAVPDSNVPAPTSNYPSYINLQFDENTGAKASYAGGTGLLQIRSGLMVGEIKLFAGTSNLANATGWLLCDGTSYNQTTYPTLYSVIGTMYGSSGGAGTFQVPNMVGYMVKGSASNANTLTGNTSNTVTLATSNVPAHTHGFSGTTSNMPSSNAISDPGHTHTFNAVNQIFNNAIAGANAANPNGPVNSSTSNASTGIDFSGVNAHNHGFSGTTDNGTGSGTAFSVENANVAITYYIWAGLY